ncbi:MAG: formylmethanofuran dehydrogenase subunit B [Methanothrix sp.]|nr:formylmethanofuran dehydrogenase subunit B [Methanothrix sp.]MCX8206972.1 formylmethanofuran dehydrogenase subunit B [Methanothrix sp.]
MAVCTGCSLLCDDIEVSIDGRSITRTKNLCRKGFGRYRSLTSDRSVPRVDGRQTSIQEAISRAAEMLRNARRPMLFGWSCSTLEAQRKGIELARRARAIIDDTSSICQGEIVDMIIRRDIPSCTLDDVRNYGDTLIFWGCDPSSSHPRHMSRFSYYPRGEKLQRGHEEDRTAFLIDIRASPTAKILAGNFVQIPPGGDSDLIDAMLAVLDGKIPKVKDKKALISMMNTLKKADMGVIFPGLGLAYSLKGRMDRLKALVDRLNETTRYNVISMVGHYNMRGFNQLLFDETGFINRVSFADGVNHGPMYSVVEASKSCDLAMIVGSDPISSLPAGIAKALARVPMITLDPHRTLTTELSRVVIPTALSGIEAGGSALRMDGVRIEFDAIVKSEYPSDEEVLSRILEEI